jgi:dTDP-4-amino-4,6-dideoxygalactose transaminase
MTMRTSFLPFHLPLISEDQIASVVETLRSGWLTTGPKVKRLEEEFRDFVGASHAVAVNSATAGLHLALEAAGVTAGDEVLLPTMTFAATAEVVSYLRATPILVDCERDTLNIDPDALEAAITPRSKAIVPVHFGGHPCQMDRIMELARAHGLSVIEDAAHALPASFEGRMVGTIGDITCFSFYATKTITTGEGGMITTENEAFAERMRLMSLHGISKDAWKRYTAEGSWFYDIVDTGFKYNLTDVAAALGIGQLSQCTGFFEARRRIAARYQEAFADLPEVSTPPCRSNVQHAWHLYFIQLDLDALTVSRAEVIELLKAANIGSSVHFIPLHLHSYYRKRFGFQREQFPVASAAFDRIISLPVYPRMDDADVADVVEAVHRIVCEHRR